MININKEKAVEIVRERLRLEREPRLAVLDLEFMMAIERGVDTSAIAAEKQDLRDVTNKDFGSLTLDELAGLTLNDALALN